MVGWGGQEEGGKGHSFSGVHNGRRGKCMVGRRHLRESVSFFCL